ncbi:MAG: alpha/beta hydrolase [Acidobacteria bacterium]|nr:alpha/beta hydrolase [Acidobacteriota bacterium]
MAAATDLAVSRVGDETAPHALVMLHGIYGRGRNWQGIARTIVAAQPSIACWLVDLPYHGDSGPSRHGNTVRGLAADVVEWMDGAGVTPAVVLGHSYGGKVAMAIAETKADQPLQTWVIDSTPEVKPPSGSAWQMLQVVRGLPSTFSSRMEAQEALMGAGYDLAVAQWMTTNLEREGETFRWRLDFDVMEQLLNDFFVTDMWRVVESPSPLHDLHILKATKSSAITDAAVARIEAASGPRVHLHFGEGGHWIHAERPDLVCALLLEHLPFTTIEE